ncbi:ATP-binding cassette domain-containing protein [Akkermansiaceae bacterium]|nr:ATP-binding cassette domain-containing protein [Akkermansiaceae bacterium]MDB4271467.1 ATP-binding cassette domain-containing protein [Akkermansiaceae bacterium]MDB4273133.1 ATP-binding cassette domain-containing protein [Akkermansiaceae bacterium]MDB4283226.1 ATP-binding cassette domain-containing protein [Akkermansiaceae bacterium]MDB4294533.1 ATP-binding cassette domain-containing protein [Akkermansiaceae bacterium]
MLELKDVCFTIQKDGEPLNLVDRASLEIPRGHFMAIVGPSGCGKTTLLKTIAGLNPESDGSLWWNGRNLSEEGDLEPWEIGYVPQFSIAYEELSVDESVETATKLRVKTHGAADLDARIDRVLEESGLTAIADRKVSVLSGGQRRRLGLAMELVSDPKLLLCDEVTSGLDPRSEREIVHLLHDISRKEGRIVLSVTHSLAHLELYDSILVLHEGRVAFHGPPDMLTHYFAVDHTELVYPQLAKQNPEKWRTSWLKHQDTYYRKLNKTRDELVSQGRLALPTDAATQKISNDDDDEEIVAEKPPKVRAPGILSQFATLLARRWKIFLRDRGQIILQLAILICFPLLVILFAEKGNEQMRRFSDGGSSNLQAQYEAQAAVQSDRMKVGGAVSGIVMFQVVLLSLMGSNNSAREIAGERQILEKEKFGGVRPSAYLLSKIAFLSTLIIIQSVWMATFVEFFWAFRGDFTQHVIFLILVNASMTSICLGISSLMRTAEQASLLSVYLVGFQLPLSGAILALPENIEVLTRPFISAYWSWSGSVKSLTGEHLTAVNSVIETSLSAVGVCFFVLLIHIFIGLIASWVGTSRHQWD